MLSQLHSNNAKEQRTKTFLGVLHAFPKGIMPVGRLDAKSEGLLFMTTDGKWSDTVNRSGIEKEYYAQVDGSITSAAVAQLVTGVTIGVNGKKYLTKPCHASVLEPPLGFVDADASLRIGRHRPSSWVRIVLKEGKFKQVRKMTAAVGYPTLRLVRVRIGDEYLTGMRPGMVLPIRSG